MKHPAFVLGLLGVLASPAFAQSGPPPGPGNGPPSEVQQHMDQARTDARTQAMTALSSDHQAAVNAVLARVKGGQIIDAHDAAKQIDAILTPKESQAVLAARDKMMADVRASMAAGGREGGPGGPGDGQAGPNGPGGGPGGFGGSGGRGGGPGGPAGGFGGPPGGGRHRGARAMRNDAGFALLTLNLDHDQMRSLLEGSRPPQ
jgi:hypothetical protein